MSVSTTSPCDVVINIPHFLTDVWHSWQADKTPYAVKVDDPYDVRINIPHIFTADRLMRIPTLSSQSSMWCGY